MRFWRIDSIPTSAKSKILISMKAFKQFQFLFDFRSKDLLTITFKFKDTTFLPMTRYEEFGIRDFLCFIGGLLGLFAGISVLSLVELFYFFTLRPLSNFLR
jgi:Amiloride-sensitive sodium channel